MPTNGHTYLYAGPYLQTRCNFGVIICKILKCSSGPPHVINNPEYKFCPFCGTPVVSAQIVKRGPLVDHRKADDLCNNLLYARYVFSQGKRGGDDESQVVLWTPCDWKNRQPIRNPTWKSHDGCFHNEINTPLIEEEVRWLRETYANEIAVLEKEYGDCSVHWGIIAEVG